MKYDRITANGPILGEIEAFCARAGMTPTAFGRGALNDPALVINLRNGRRLWPETHSRIRDFMAKASLSKTGDAA